MTIKACIIRWRFDRQDGRHRPFAEKHREGEKKGENSDASTLAGCILFHEFLVYASRDSWSFDFTLLIAQRLHNHIDPEPDIIIAWMMNRTSRGERRDD